jgi:hypothetical protein
VQVQPGVIDDQLLLGFDHELEQRLLERALPTGRVRGAGTAPARG